jgi:glycerophosphoryl diester phosphodiesterase
MAGTLYAAHRGGAALWPENSLLAFGNALARGADLLELDVHPTVDGRVAVIHDTTLDRTTDGTGPIIARTAGELRARRLRGPDGALTDERLPLLEDVLALAAPTGAGLLVEIKGPTLMGRYEGLEEKVLAALAEAGLGARANVMAFGREVLTRVRALSGDHRTTLLVARAHVEQAKARPVDVVAWARAAGATDVGIEHTLADVVVLAAARRDGIKVGVWTVNDEPSMRRLIDLGVDVLTTDRPDLAARSLGRPW